MKLIFVVLWGFLMCLRSSAQCTATDAIDLNDEGLRHLAADNSKMAINCLQRSLAADPKLAVANFNLGVIYFKADELDKAIKHLERSVEDDPKYAKAHDSLGVAYRKRGQADKAITSLTTAIALDPDNWGPHCNLATLYADQEKLKDAGRELNIAIGLGAPLAWVHRIRGYCAYRRKHYDEAKMDLLVAANLDPNDEDSQLMLTRLFMLTKQKDIAIDQCQRFKTERPPLAAKIYDILYGSSFVNSPK